MYKSIILLYGNASAKVRVQYYFEIFLVSYNVINGVGYLLIYYLLGVTMYY